MRRTTGELFKPPFTWDDEGIGKELVAMLLLSGVLLLILLIVESRFAWRMFASIFTKECNCQDVATDSDVLDERARVAHVVQSATFSDSLTVDSLYKRFGQVTAVNNLSFGVHPKECFGLLGVNGAGKTTTFKMMTADILPNVGNVFASQTCSLEQNVTQYQTMLGYCPQFDPLLDKLTGKEMLYLMGRIRGISSKNLSRVVEELVETVNLQAHVNKMTENYSGGNKRKLSLALALIGSPQLLLLDEPTSGVDPAARRKIWTTLANVRHKYGCAIILTSHSMDECEALCARVGIMVNGQFQCLGSIQHLRSKFGKGYSITVKLKRTTLSQPDQPEIVNMVHQAIVVAIPSAVLKDVHETVASYHITDVNTTWSAMFYAMEGIKSTWDLEDYVLGDTTLEQIFVSFARHQAAQTK